MVCPNMQAMKDAQLVDVLNARLVTSLDGIMVGDQRVKTLGGEQV